MAFDYKKTYKEFYLPPRTPGIIEIPKMQYVAVRGKGNPNELDGDYKASIGLLYAVSFTLRMSPKSGHTIDGYFEYVVPPLEGLWWQADRTTGAIDYTQKDSFEWISMIRLPDFVTEEVFDWAVREVSEKKGHDLPISTSKAEFLTYQDGLCVQCMHIGSYDSEPATIRKMEEFVAENGYAADFSETRYHHEIYLSDPRRTAEDKLRTVIRHPVRRL